MRVLKWIGIGALILIVFPLGYCALTWPYYSWHQKMTVQVEVDGKTYSGSSVSYVFWRQNDSFSAMHGPAWVSGVKGEAVVIELPENKYLFALLSYAGNTEYTANLATRVMASEPKHRVWGENAFRAVLEKKGKAPLVLSEDHYPLFVTFKDIKDPASVERYLPYRDDAWQSNIKLKKITLEITDEPVTRGRVEKVLGWIDEYRENNYRLNGKKCVACPVKSENISDLISTSEFLIGG